MPNAFRHQSYTSGPPVSPFQLVAAAAGPPAGSDEFRRRMSAVGAAIREAGVAVVYLVHGTFAGQDAAGLWSELERVLPGASDALRRATKALIDALAGDGGNYTAEFAQLLESAINSAGQRHLSVKLFHWSSENHHLGRADGAVRLIDELLSLELSPQQRVMLWGHSHAGNVFALLTNILGGDLSQAARFFEAARIYYRWPLAGWVDIRPWRRVADALSGNAALLAENPLDIVTFGTPVRYGWDRGGYAQLLHFIHHRPATDLPPYRAPFPPAVERMLSAADGDYVQQFGIAGTNIIPSPLAWRALLADRRLNELLQPGLPAKGLLARLQAGVRVPDAGHALLVDYGPVPGNVAQHMAGHALYTRKEWMLFHAEEVVRRFYPAHFASAGGEPPSQPQGAAADFARVP